MRMMKIDFNSNGMTINFDKVPKFLYFNEEGYGCGQVFLDGVKKSLIHSVYMKSHTVDDEGQHPLQFRIKYGEKGIPGFKTLSSNLKPEMEIAVKILDLEEFSQILKTIEHVLGDERIPENIRQEYLDSFKEFTNRFEKMED
jgi:hypothetical protein